MRAPFAEAAAQDSSGEHEQALAAGSVAQQAALVVGTLTMLAVLTAIARTMSLSEFGVYGLLISIPTYLLFVQGSVESAAVRAIAQACSERERDRALTTALGVYTCFGLLAAALIAVGGVALLGVFRIPRELHAEARLGLVALGAVNVFAWPAKVAQDVLRASRRFVASGVAEAMGFVTFAVLIGLALALSAPLWLIAGLGGVVPLCVGLWSIATLLLAVRLPLRPRPSTLSWPYTRSFMGISFYLLLSGLADFVIYSLDRTVLGIYRPAATIGLYEGPVRAHNLVRQLQAAMMLTVMPAAAAYVAAADHVRLRELLIRGTRYVTLAVTPVIVTLMVLARPILEVWLGARFETAATAMTIFVCYWLFASGLGVGQTMMMAAGRMRVLVAYAAAVAVLNLAISLALAPRLGLEGVVLGTSVAYLMLVPLSLRLICETFAVPVGDLLREGFALAFATGTLLAAFELLARLALPIDRASVLAPTIALGVLGYVLIVYRAVLRPRERLLVRTVLVAARRRLSFPTMPAGSA